MKFVVTQTSVGLVGLEIPNPSMRVKVFLKSIICNPHPESEEYKLTSRSGANISKMTDDLLVIDFWKPDYQAFINYCNLNYTPF